MRSLRCSVVLVTIMPVAALAQVRRDSAGISIISYDVRAVAPTTWNVDRSPVLEIGGVDGAGPTELANVVGVVRLTHGTIVVANGATRELRFFDSGGRYLRTAGGHGRGPGEMGDLSGLFVSRDTVIAAESRYAAHVYSASGAWLRSVAMPVPGEYILNPLAGAFSSDAVLAPLQVGARRNIQAVRRDSLWLARIGLSDTSVRIIGALPLAPNYGLAGRRPIYPLGYAPRTLYAASALGVCTGYPVRFEVRCADTLGNVRVIMRRDTRRRAVTDSARTAYRFVESGRRPDGSSRFEGSLREHRERVAAATVFTQHYPAYSGLVLSHTGEVWVESFRTEDGIYLNPRHSPSTATTWSVFAADGRWIADCVLPPRFAPDDIGRDYVLGVSRDNDDVERVTLLRLRR